MSAELNELRESVRQVLGESGLAADESKTWPLALELGWLLAAVPEDVGGLGQGLPGACAFYEEFGRSLSAAPYTAAMLSIDTLVQAAPADLDNWLERLTTRDFVTTALTDSSVEIRLQDGDRPRVQGSLSAVPSADKASHVLVCSADGQCVALIPIAQSGVALQHRPTWDETRRLFDIRLQDVELDRDLILATGAAAQSLSRRLATHRDIALAADAVGGAAAMLEATVEYLKTRRQFGRPLALFQALKHRCADLKALVSGAEALLLDSVGRIGERLDSDAAEAAALAAKQLACNVYAKVTEEALQLHGGIGMTAEHICHLYLKRAMLNDQLGRAGARYDLDIADRYLNGL